MEHDGADEGLDRVDHEADDEAAQVGAPEALAHLGLGALLGLVLDA